MPSVVAATVHFVTILPFVGLAFWVGIVWRRANRYGAWSCAIGSAAVLFGLQWAGYSTAWSSLASLATGLVLIVVVSRLTPAEPQESLDKIFLPLYKPVNMEEIA